MTLEASHKATEAPVQHARAKQMQRTDIKILFRNGSFFQNLQVIKIEFGNQTKCARCNSAVTQVKMNENLR